MRTLLIFCLLAAVLALLPGAGLAKLDEARTGSQGSALGSTLGRSKSPVDAGHIFNPGTMAPRASELKVQPGDTAPGFNLPSVGGDKISLADFHGKQYVVLSFVPAAFTPVCSEQWPAYNLGRDELQKREAVVLGITVDNIPALYAWTKDMGTCWFPVLSDFYPHGEVAQKYGVLRPEGVTERAVFIIDKKGTVRHAEVHDINRLPRLKNLLDKLDEIRAEDARR